MAAFKIEKRPESEKDQWLDGYGCVAGTIGVWGVAMWIMTKIFNGVKLTKTDETNAETTDEE